MFIGHFPAGYLAMRAARARGHVMMWGLIGAVAPDLDMLAFHFWYDGAVHHHNFVTHRPAVWAGITVVALLGLWLGRQPWAFAMLAFGAAGLLHMCLDSIVGQIAWGWPFSEAAAPLVVVSATHDWWVMSFLTHWTFGVELIVCATALLVWWRRS
ncbi:MAG: metal-dependent hydrolase [Sedimentitalea sp.]